MPSVPSLSTGTCLPKIVVDAVYRADLAERHLDPVADGDAPGVDVGHLAAEAPAAVEVDDGGDDGRRKRERQAVDGVGGNGGRRLGEALLAHAVDGPAVHADP